MIMPLASEHDKRTQVLWGIADFRHRFGRDPEGMWLAETAVDVASLEALAEAGIRFTILAPHQARRWRKLGEKEWAEIPRRDRPVAGLSLPAPLGPVDRPVLLRRDHLAAGRLRAAAGRRRAVPRTGSSRGSTTRREHAQLMHIATDGESYGHHHAHGDMALAYVLERLARATPTSG